MWRRHASPASGAGEGARPAPRRRPSPRPWPARWPRAVSRYVYSRHPSRAAGATPPSRSPSSSTPRPLAWRTKDGVLQWEAGRPFRRHRCQAERLSRIAHSASVEVKSDPSPRRVAPGAHPRARRLELRAGAISAARRGRLHARRWKRRVRPRGAGLDDGPLTMSGVMLISPSEPMVLTLGAERSTRSSSKPMKCYSDLCSAPAAAGGATPLSAGSVKPWLQGRLPGPPTTQREFEAGDQVALALEVYNNKKRGRKDQPAVITLTTDLRGADGVVMPLVSEERRASDQQSAPTHHAFAIRLPLDDVAEGAYVLRVGAIERGPGPRRQQGDPNPGPLIEVSSGAHSRCAARHFTAFPSRPPSFRSRATVLSFRQLRPLRSLQRLKEAPARSPARSSRRSRAHRSTRPSSRWAARDLADLFEVVTDIRQIEEHPGQAPRRCAGFAG